MKKEQLKQISRFQTDLPIGLVFSP